MIEAAERDSSPEARESPSFYYLSKLLTLMQLYGCRDEQKSFGLVNRDFGFNNLLVNDNFEIVGLIDLTCSIMAAPIEMVAQFPTDALMDRPMPGRIETNPHVNARQRKEAPKLVEYSGLIREAIEEQGCPEHLNDLADLINSDAARVVQGLDDYNPDQEWYNDQWLECYNFLLSKASGGSNVNMEAQEKSED
jgi:hypothetical protein